MPGIDEPIDGYPDGGIWPTSGIVVLGGATSEQVPAVAAVRLGGSATTTVLRRQLAEVLECCRSASATNAQVRFGSATWDATPKHNGDHLSRYYPLWLNEHDVLAATTPVRKPDVLATLRATGRDIRDVEFHYDAAGSGPMQDSEDGKMCEIPEQFRVGRFYDIPLGFELDPQPEGRDPLAPPALQWNWFEGFTATWLYRYRSLRQEQTLLSLSPALRCGVSWLGELVLNLTLENGEKLNAWSTQKLVVGDWSHLALSYDPHRKSIRVFLNGANVVSLNYTRSIGSVQSCYFGRWDTGSLMNGEAQDLRIYDSVVRTEFIQAEVNSYCADWVEVVS